MRDEFPSRRVGGAAVFLALLVLILIGRPSVVDAQPNPAEPPPAPPKPAPPKPAPLGPPQIVLARADGGEAKPLVTLKEYTAHGSPVWSQDGSLIAFDAWRPQLGESSRDAHIVVTKADGPAERDARILSDGALPSFSPRGRRIAFSRYAPNRGVWVMSVEGPAEELVLLDENGWSAEWSPDGKQIAYTKSTGRGTNIAVYDLVEGDRRLLFDEEQPPYRSIYWSFTWSPDSKQLVFKGTSQAGQAEVAVVDARGSEHGLKVLLSEDVTPNFAWSPDGDRLLFPMRCPDRKRIQLYTLDPTAPGKPELLPEQDPACANLGAAYSPDGKRLAIATRQPVPADQGGK